MFTGSGDVVVPGSHFANHWARAWEAREKERVGSESRDHIMEDLITMKVHKQWYPAEEC